MGEQMLRHIYEVNQAWGSMLVFYSDLNNARKEGDAQYINDQGIGEEISEPDDRVVFQSDVFDQKTMVEKKEE